MTETRRVVVTGLGVISPVGNDVPSAWEAILAGRSGTGPITRFDAAAYDVHFAAEVKGFDPTRYMDGREVRRNDRNAWYMLAAANEALREAGLEGGVDDPDRVGVIIGSGIGGLEELEAQHTKLIERGPGRVSPFLIPKMMLNAASGAVSIRYGFRGPCYATASACASAAHAIGDGFRSIRSGEADVVVTGGTEAAVTPIGIAGFAVMKALSFRNDDPAGASRPFDKDRDGFVMGEGAAAIVLEERERARARGATIHAELLGYGTTADAHHMTAPDPEGAGAARTMRKALEDGRTAPEGVDYINAHGTSTPLNDRIETRAIKSLFGEHARKLAVSSTKSMTGHTLGASGAIELVFTVKTVATGRIPPTINYTTPDPDCDLDYVPNEAREGTVRTALSNSFGFGGHNVSLLVGRHD